MSDLNNPLVCKGSYEPVIISHGENIYRRSRYMSHSDEWESTRKLTAPSTSPHLSYSSASYHSTSTHIDMDFDAVHPFQPNSDDILPRDAFSESWKCSMSDLLYFNDDIDDQSLCKKIRNHSYSARSLQLQEIVACLPSSIALEIISYELSSNAVEIFVRRSMAHNVLKKFDLRAFVSGWILTFIGIYLFLCGLNLFGMFKFIPSEIAIYFIGNYTNIGWVVELSTVLLLCTMHFYCIFSVYRDGRKCSTKLNRVKKVLHFSDAENCGEVYVPALRWLGFPFVEAFNLDFKWFLLIGFKYWIMTVFFIILCLPFWIFQASFVWLIFSIPAVLLCCIGAWLQAVTFQNINDLCSAMLYAMIWLMQTSPPRALYKNYNTVTRLVNGHFDILNILLAAIFIVALIWMELRIIHSWKSVSVRYNYFGWQLLASMLIVMIFGVLGLDVFLFFGALLVLYNAAVIWNDLMHKKIMQTTYGVNKVEYVNKYRPIYNTDKDSEWLTYVFTMCCSKDNCISKCRGRWVINCYAGLVTGTITTPTYLL